MYHESKVTTIVDILPTKKKKTMVDIVFVDVAQGSVILMYGMNIYIYIYFIFFTVYLELKYMNNFSPFIMPNMVFQRLVSYNKKLLQTPLTYQQIIISTYIFN